MRKLTSIILLLLVQLSISMPGIFAQNPSTELRVTVTLPDSIAGKGWVRNLIKEEFKKFGTIPTDPVVVDPAKEPCKAGPTIIEISNVSATYLNVLFHGDDVRKFSWTIKDASGNAVRDGKISPANSKPGVTYNSLPAGSYTLSITGESCRSDVSSKPFTIAGSVGVITPPVSGGGFDSAQPDTPSTIAKGMDEHLLLDWKKDGDGYVVSDLANVSLGSNHELRYLIGSEVIKTGRKPLTGYRISGFNPGRIVKYKIKPGFVLNQWDQGVVYYDNNTGETFSGNTSVAYQTFAFPGAAGDFVNPIPGNYNPGLQNVQWGDIAPDMQLPPGHVYVADPRPWGIPHAMRKGVTHISNFALPWEEGQPYTELIRLRDTGKSYNDVPRIETVFGIQKSGSSGALWLDNTSKDWWPNGAPSYDQAYEIGLRADISNALFVGEMSENESWLPPSSSTFKGFYAALRPRYEQRFGSKGIPYWICHDYIWLGGVKLNSGNDKAYYKKILSLAPSQQPANDYTPGGSLTETNLIVETVYLGAPDLHVAQPYELIFRLEYINQLGYNAGAFLAPIHEWKPNNMLEIPYPEGKFYAHTKIPLDPNVNIANGFLAQTFGNVYIEWGGNVKTKDRLIHRNWFGTAFFWFPNGATSPQPGFPHFKETSDFPTYYGYNGSADLGHFSQVLFASTYGAVEGGKDQYLKFRIDGKAWVNPTEHDYIDAYFDKRAFVHSRTKDGKTAFFFLNCFTDNATHTLEVVLPSGKTWTGKVAGNGIHAKLL